MRALVLLLLAGVCLLAPQAVATAAAPSANTCGFIRASVPYSPGGHAKKWRVYVTGKASCAAARRVLDAVMHLHGKVHEVTSDAGSYTTYAGWLCPFGQMGFQACQLPARPPDHGPVRATALARSCTGFEESCPAKLPAGEV
ncbi:MAG TPA: hypothetical protein VMD79_15885 [Solirubrobacteraceae bacterium]|nr:hypothetical protein [Solirubrobacteraceae bacterium]